MAEKSFDDFVRREHQAAQVLDGEPIDWQREKNEWLEQLDQLFAQITEYLGPYVTDGQIKIAYSPIELNEENIGPYSAKEMIIAIGGKIIKLEPIGTLFIGTKGRVDVVGPFSRARLMLLNSHLKSLSQLFKVSVHVVGKALPPPKPRTPSVVEWAWRIVARPPRQELTEFNKENFLNLLLEVSNG
jgi:hypothetical protein